MFSEVVGTIIVLCILILLMVAVVGIGYSAWISLTEGLDKPAR